MDLEDRPRRVIGSFRVGRFESADLLIKMGDLNFSLSDIISALCEDLRERVGIQWEAGIFLESFQKIVFARLAISEVVNGCDGVFLDRFVRSLAAYARFHGLHHDRRGEKEG